MTSTTGTSSTYTPFSHLHSQTIIETGQESLFNQRKQVRLVNAALKPCNSITTLNMHLPTDQDPFNYMTLPQERLVEFNQISRGLVCEAKRRMPKRYTVGNFSNEEMAEERRRQYRINKATFPNPNNSSIHTPLNFIETSGYDMEESLNNDNLHPANLSLKERVKNLYQSDCSDERRIRILQKDNTRKAVAPEESDSESEDNSDEDSIEQDYEES
jgi:hypothetical protein